MSLRTIGYQDGKPVRVDEGPAYGGSVKLGGSLVTSEELRRDPVPQPRVVEYALRDLPKACALDGRCRHRSCTALRAQEARRLHDTTNLTLGQIGAMLGGRNYSTVIYLLQTGAGKAR